MSATLHTPSTIFSSRHVPSWLLLAFSAGAVNATAFFACKRFVTHVTGTATQLGFDVLNLWLVLEYAVVLACFVVGAMSSVLALDARLQRGKRPLWAAPLVAVALLLAGVAVAGHLGTFGPFGASVEEPSDFLMLSVLAFAMGLQNAAVATSTGLAVRTTHMTGPATDLGIHLATSFFTAGATRRAALRGAALRGGKIAAFILGAVAAVPLTGSGGYLAFLLPAVIVVLAAAMSFVPEWSGVDVRSPAAPAT